MRRLLTYFLLCMTLFTGVSAAAAPVLIDGMPLDGAEPVIYHNTTYVSLRAAAQALHPGIQVTWTEGRAVAHGNEFLLSAQPGALYIAANDRAIFIPDGVRLENGRTLVPIRPLAALMGAEVSWDPGTGAVSVTSGARSAEAFYDSDALYWLSHIISAESQGEPLVGKIAVGNVILNRVASADFPGTIYGVIFDDRWGGQFEPVRRGSIYWEPTEESVLAAKLVLEGAQVAGDSLYFLAPALTNNHWIIENRPYVTTIGCHWFYA